MVKVRVRYFGRLVDITGKKEEIVEVEGKTVKELIETLRRIYGDRIVKAIIDKNTQSLREDVIILVDQKPIGDNLESQLLENSKVSILPFVSGG